MRTALIVIGLPLVLSLLTAYIIIRLALAMLVGIFTITRFLLELRTPRVVVRYR